MMWTRNMFMVCCFYFDKYNSYEINLGADNNGADNECVHGMLFLF